MKQHFSLSLLMQLMVIFLLTLGFNNVWANTSQSNAVNEKVDFSLVVQEIEAKGNDILLNYSPKNASQAVTHISSLYFDYYEGKGMELAVTTVSPAVNSKTESLFTQLIGEAAAGESLSQLQSSWNQLKAQLSDNLVLLKNSEAKSFSQVAIQSFIILLREGFEAMLVVTALLAYLRRSGNQDKKRVVHYGVGLALVASAITAYLLNTLFRTAGASSEGMEGLTMLLAAAVLFYVSNWLFAKREAERWQAYIKEKMQKALTTGSLFALGAAAFLAVYREGAETILFYQALLSNAHNFQWALLVGIIAAVFALVGIYWAIQMASVRIPYSLFFTATAAFLFYMAFYFVGGAMLEMQEAGWIAITPISSMPTLSWLGIYPTWQSFGAQLIFLLPVSAALIWHYCCHHRRYKAYNKSRAVTQE